MYIRFEINGHVTVPELTEQVDRSANLFRLPSGEILSVHPVIEMSTDQESDDYRDLTTVEAAAIGVHMDLYDRESVLEDE